MRKLKTLAERMDQAGGDELPFHQDFTRNLTAASQWLAEVVTNAEFVLTADNEDYVYWIEKVPQRQGSARAHAAPLDIGELLSQQLYAEKDTVIFCSATLSIRGSFSFIRKRLGVDRIEPERVAEFNAGSPFDYMKQCMVAVPTFLPEPNEKGRDYAQELGQLLTQVFRRTRGRGMGLFTSYGMLRETTTTLQEGLRNTGIRLLAQGQSGSRENILASFQNDLESVLMGTHSFWEGVDIAGESLSCLVLARLPFAVFTDPVFEARCEQLQAQGFDSFSGYSLPTAVIRFRQGFGRLIRHRDDRGVVIVADRRIMTRRYGGWFRASLPTSTVQFSDRDQFLEAITEFFEQEPSQ